MFLVVDVATFEVHHVQGKVVHKYDLLLVVKGRAACLPPPTDLSMVALATMLCVADSSWERREEEREALSGLWCSWMKWEAVDVERGREEGEEGEDEEMASIK